MSKRFIRVPKIDTWVNDNNEFLWEVRGPSLRYDNNQAWLVSDEAASSSEEDEEVQLMSARSIINTELTKLPKREQQIIKLYIEGTKVGQIAKKLKIKSQTVSKTLKRVGKKLKKFIPTFQQEDK